MLSAANAKCFNQISFTITIKRPWGINTTIAVFQISKIQLNAEIRGKVRYRFEHPEFTRAFSIRNKLGQNFADQMLCRHKIDM